MSHLLLAVLMINLPAAAAEPNDSAGNSRQLDEISVVATGPRKVLRHTAGGIISIDGSLLGEMPGLMATPDPVSVLRSLSAVATPNDLQAAISVHGGSPGENVFYADGVRIVNPMHMLGLYSAYNPSFYKGYTFRAERIPAHIASGTAGLFEATSTEQPIADVTGEVTTGLIESHFGMEIPIVPNRCGVAIGARRTYLNLLFPDILTLGSSALDYGFSDANFAVTAALTKDDFLKISGLYAHDKMKVNNRTSGSKDGDFGWTNYATAATWTRGHASAGLSYTGYENNFRLDEGGRSLDLPSRLDQITATYLTGTGSHWIIESDVSFRHTSGQYNRSIQPHAVTSRRSAEINAGATYRVRHRAIDIETGMRFSYYHCGSYNTFIPQPRINLIWNISDAAMPFAAYNRLVQFDRLVQETSGSLPADFRTCADKKVPPQDVHSFQAGISGRISGIGLNYMLEGYYRISRHSAEFTGSLMDLTSSGYNPLDDYAFGRGYAYGVSITVMRQFGKLRGRLSYNIGKSRVRIPDISTGYFPTSQDRLHDLNVSITYQPVSSLTISAFFTHATGIPYTQAKYGYMIGENLICEYFPHNSSRLPSYNRLDLGAGYVFRKGQRVRHKLTLSVYNVLKNQNVLFVYSSYSISEGISHRQSVMKTMIPSLAYTLQF